MDTIYQKICTELWAQYEPNLRRLCKIKLQNYPDETDEVISELFLALCRKVSESGPPDNPKAWLYAAANNLINLKYRKIYKDKEKTVSLSDREYELPYTNDFADEIEDNILVEQLKEDLDKELTQQEKAFLGYIYQDGLKMKDIASLLNTTEAAVKQKHYRLINKIRKTAKKIF